MNIITDTNLVGTQYNWLGSAFYVGYLAAEYPVNRKCNIRLTSIFNF
jgi:hypothetical protein